MFEEPKRLSPTHKNNSSNTIVQNKTLNNIPMSLSKNSSIQNRVGFINPDRPQMGCMQLKANMFSKGENQASNIIQRRIGFEFQTNCHVSKSIIENGQIKKVCLPKNELLLYGVYANAVADDHIEQCSDVEFVTKPINNYGDLKKTEVQMKVMWNFLKKVYVNKHKKYNGYTFEMIRGAELRGNPQVTFGTSLSNIKLIANAARKQRIKSGIKSNEKLSAIKRTKTSNFHGLIELIKSYLRSAEDKEEIIYPKKITDSFLLSRTDFGSLIKLCKESLPPTLKKWLDIFRAEFIIDTPLFPHIKEKSGEEWNINLTIKEWLSLLYNCQRDIISDVRDNESMSSMGLDTVMHYPEGEELVGVYELRANQGIKHYLNGQPSWFEFMDYWYKTIEKTGYLPPYEIAKKD